MKYIITETQGNKLNKVLTNTLIKQMMGNADSDGSFMFSGEYEAPFGGYGDYVEYYFKYILSDRTEIRFNEIENNVSGDIVIYIVDNKFKMKNTDEPWESFWEGDVPRYVWDELKENVLEKAWSYFPEANFRVVISTRL